MAGTLTGRPCFFLGLLIFLIAWTSRASAEFIDGIAAAVNNHVITWSEVRQAVKFNKAVSGAVADGKNIEAETLEGLINRNLLIREARRLKFGDVPEDDVAAEIERIRARFGTERAFQAFLTGTGMTEERLRRALGEGLLAERFVEKKIGLFVRVSAEESQRYYDSHNDDYKGRRFEEVRKTIKTLLMERKMDQELTRYLSEIRSKATIRVNVEKR